MIRITAVLRTRLAGAVLMPAILAASISFARGVFLPFRFLLMLAGLCAAEFADLLAADLVKKRAECRASAGSAARSTPRSGTHGAPPRSGTPRVHSHPSLPGSPVSAWLLEKKSWALVALLTLAGIGTAVLVVSFSWAGPGLLLLLGGAALCAFLYAFQPFPGSFLATVAVPALITGGMYYVLAGRWDAGAFVSGAPICLVSAGVILTYRLAYRQGRVRPAWRTAVMLCYGAALLLIIVLTLIGVYGRFAPLAIAPGAVFSILALKFFALEKRDHVPATSAGVVLHASLSLGIAAFSLL